MRWYDVFSGFYDRSLEPLYRQQRQLAAEALAPEPDSLVLDLPCGTGQSFDAIAPRLDPTRGGALVGVDLSAGMLRHAANRVTKNGWPHVHVLAHDVHGLDQTVLAQALAALGGAAGVNRAIDRLHIFLGMSAFPEHERAFDRLWGLLAPGGRCVIVDVYAERPDFQGRMVNLVARADIRRQTWVPLERVAHDYERRELPSQKQHGGQLFLATGIKR
jgi:cyclopropane fatty-acyl-phospholipid synthase-like methyltransferase